MDLLVTLSAGEDAQLAALVALLGISQSAVLTLALDRFYRDMLDRPAHAIARATQAAPGAPAAPQEP